MGYTYCVAITDSKPLDRRLRDENHQNYVGHHVSFDSGLCSDRGDWVLSIVFMGVSELDIARGKQSGCLAILAIRLIRRVRFDF